MLNFLGRNTLKKMPLIVQSYYPLKTNKLQFLPKYLLGKRVFPYFEKVYVLSQEEYAFFLMNWETVRLEFNQWE